MAFGGFGGFGASSSAAGGFGGFGGAPSSAAGGFGGFGAASSSAAGGFGAASSSAGGFGGFGAASSAAAGGFGGFGASSSAAGGFGGFGASSSAAGGFGGFGAASSGGGFGGFGGSSSSGGFGASSSAAGGFGGFGGGGFGASSSSPGGFGGFGGGFGSSSSSSGFGGFGAAPQAQPAPDPYATSLAGQGDHEVLPKFYNLWKQYYEKSPQCFCMAFIYTLVSESSIAACWEATRQKYQAERYYITEGQWEQAKRDNPDPSRLLPCPIRSVAELSQRNEIQVKQIDRYEQEKKLLTNQLQEMKRVFNHQEPGSLDRKAKDIKLRVSRLRSRLLEAVANLERARPARSAMGRDQGALDDKLQKVETTCNEYHQDLYELDVVLSSHNQRYSKVASNTVLPNETMTTILSFLDHQQKGLANLGSIITSCKEDLEIIQGKNPPRMAPLVSGQQSFSTRGAMSWM